MSWQIILILVALVAAYVIADACFDVSAKISKAFGGFKWPDFGKAIGNVIGLVGKNPYMALVAVIGLPALVWGTISYIEGRGADKVTARIERQNTENTERIGRAQTNFERDVRERMERAAVREYAISEEFGDVQRTIHEAQGREAIAAAHAAGVERLRVNAGSRHAAVVSDYHASLGDRRMSSPPPL